LAEFHAAGGTDYLCFVIVYGNDGRLGSFSSGAAVSFTTDRPGGFTDGEVAMIADLLPAFGAALRVGADLSKTRTLLDTYLGRDVGRRVLSGEVRRGSVEAMSAAIVVGDLRGFTVLADEVPRDRLVSMLDDYLDCLVGPVEASDGQVLKFLGDGLLATFAFDTRAPQDVCRDALAAAIAALQRIDALNHQRRQDGLPVMTLDLALHAGEVLYGNVGSDRRLDFTIVGPAVNEAARLEALCATLDVALVASRRFVDLLGTPEKFRSLGPRALRGVREPVEVFTLS
jgi:adenylate cyclase